MSKNILYTLDCPKCKVLKKKLDDKGITYEINTDVEEMKELGIEAVPMFMYNKDLLDFSQTLNLIKELEE